MSSRPSITIVVPTRDEMGNIEPCVKRMPDFGVPTEILFVDGNSSDGTIAEIARVKLAWPDRDIGFQSQRGKGKRAAVFEGFEAAKGELVFILDGDITVPPEELPQAYERLAGDPDLFINGTRFLYPMEKEAMQFPNWVANRFFALFVWLIVGVKFTDTLCGTKGLWKKRFLELRDAAFLTGIDRYGDHELIFGAWNLRMKFAEVPFHYKARLWGEAKIANQKLSGGMIFLRMCFAALWAKLTLRAPRKP